MRSEQLVEAYLRFGSTLERLSMQLGDQATAAALIGVSKATVEYNGWWILAELAPLGRRVPLDMTEEQFLARCVTVMKLFEGLSEKRLRRLCLSLGIENGQVKSYKSLKLLGLVIHLCETAQTSGLSLATDREEITARLVPDSGPPNVLGPLFALSELRGLSAHAAGRRQQQKLNESY